MDIKSKIFSFLSAIKDFFLEEDKATKDRLEKFDLLDIFVALCPAALFGCLIFGWRAVLVLAVSVAIPVVFDFLWKLILKKKFEFNFKVALGGLILGMSFSSKLSFWLVLAVCVVYAVLNKLVFEGKELFLVFPALIVRAVASIVCYDAFQVYLIPFTNTVESVLPIDRLFITTSFVEPAKYLFFGLHMGNIGGTSEIMILLGLIYLMLRKVINPVVPTCFIGSHALFNIIFGRSISVSLLGGSLFFGAFAWAMDYSFKTTARYKKMCFGFLCGVLSFAFREVVRVEAVSVAILCSYLIMLYINRKNIKFVIEFFKNIDYKGFVKKFISIFKAKAKE